jgi:hypothetical protein
MFIARLCNVHYAVFKLFFFTRSRISEEYLRRVCAAVLADEDLAAIGRGIPRLLVEQIRAGVLCQQERQESLLMPVKGTVSRGFRLQVFFIESYYPQPRSIPLGPVSNFISKYSRRYSQLKGTKA